MATFLTIIIVLLFFQLLFVMWNVSQLPSLGNPLPNNHLDTDLPLISILIPARNEEGNIKACLESILQEQAYPIEVCVLDDRSDDRTGEIVKDIAEGDQRVRLIQGVELEEGWMGKSYACHQLAQQANGEWFLFLDADLRLKRGTLGKAIATAMYQRKGLISGFPFQEVNTWLEKLVVPMMMFTIACHLPIRFVQHKKDPKFVAAHGAFLFIHKNTYKKIGGHAAFKKDLVDDMSMGRAVKKAGDPVMLADVHNDLTMRMYERASQVWKGYKKNLYPGMGYNPWLFAGVLTFYTCAYLLPLLTLIGSILIPSWFWPSLIAYSLGVIIKLVIDWKNGQPLYLAFFLPFSILFVNLIGIDSWRASQFQQGYEWKGRTYQ